MRGICGIAGDTAIHCKKELQLMLDTMQYSKYPSQDILYFDNCILGSSQPNRQAPRHEPRQNTGNGGSARPETGFVCDGRLLFNDAAPEPEASIPFIINRYHERGIQDVCRSLNGTFSFALWIENEQCLVCGRDRIGAKPLYYAVSRDKTKLLFASEIQAIIASGLVEPRLRQQALSEYLALVCTPENSCIYEHIQLLEPGSCLTWKNQTVTVQKYWELPLPFDTPPSFDEAKEELVSLLRKAVARCMAPFAHDDIGILLSGGLDSSTIAALSSTHKKLRSFCFGFGDKDERPYAHAVANLYDLPLQELDDSQLDVPDLLQTLCKAYGEPFGDSSAIPSLFLCKMVSEETGAVLGGDGADELLGGYANWYRPLLPLAGKKTFFTRQNAVIKRHWEDMLKFTPRKLHSAGLPLITMPLPEYQAYTVDDALRMDLRFFLPSAGLRKMDRSSRQYGLELCLPFLDTDLVEFLVALPPSYKITADHAKFLMREAFSDLWPDAVKNRRKQGFGYDVGKWLKLPGMQELCRYYLNDPARKIYSVMPASWLKRYAGQTRKKTWLLLILAIWLEDSAWTL